MTKKLSLFVGGGLVLTCILAGCGNQNQTSSTASSKKVITMWEFDDNPSKEAVQNAVNLFMKEHPDITVKLEQPAPWSSALTRITTAIQSGSAPDVVQVAFPWTYGLAQKGALLNLSPLLKKWGKENDFIPAALKMGEYNGNIYALPWQLDTYGLVYRADLFKQKGLTPPTTEQDIIHDAQALTDTAKGQYGIGFSGGDIFYPLTVSFWANNSDLIKQDSSGHWQVAFNNTGGMNVMKFYYDLVNKYHVAPTSVATINQFSDVTQGFEIGEFAMAYMNPFMAESVLQDKPNLQIGVAQFPAGSAGSVSKLGGRSLVIPKSSKNPDTAWELIKFLESDTAYTNALNKIDEFPSQQSVLNKIQWSPVMKPFVDMLKNARTYPNVSQFGAIQQIVDKGFQQYLAQGNEQQVMSDMTTQINALLK